MGFHVEVRLLSCLGNKTWLFNQNFQSRISAGAIPCHFSYLSKLHQDRRIILQNKSTKLQKQCFYKFKS